MPEPENDALRDVRQAFLLAEARRRAYRETQQAALDRTEDETMADDQITYEDMKADAERVVAGGESSPYMLARYVLYLLEESADKTAELDQYGAVVMRGKRLPAPDLAQDPAFAAFVLGKLEDRVKELEQRLAGSYETNGHLRELLAQPSHSYTHQFDRANAAEARVKELEASSLTWYADRPALIGWFAYADARGCWLCRAEEGTADVDVPTWHTGIPPGAWDGLWLGPLELPKGPA